MRLDVLRDVMDTKGVSVRELARRTGMNRNTLAGKLTGRREFNVDDASLVCDALEITDNATRAFIFFSKVSQK